MDFCGWPNDVFFTDAVFGISFDSNSQAFYKFTRRIDDAKHIDILELKVFFDESSPFRKTGNVSFELVTKKFGGSKKSYVFSESLGSIKTNTGVNLRSTSWEAKVIPKTNRVNLSYKNVNTGMNRNPRAAMPSQPINVTLSPYDPRGRFVLLEMLDANTVGSVQRDAEGGFIRVTYFLDSQALPDVQRLTQKESEFLVSLLENT